MKNEQDIENLIEYMKGKGVSIQAIVDKINIDRNYFNSWRKSTKKARRDELKELIMKAFPEETKNVEAGMVAKEAIGAKRNGN
jgi:hypothetical protein